MQIYPQLAWAPPFLLVQNRAISCSLNIIYTLWIMQTYLKTLGNMQTCIKTLWNMQIFSILYGSCIHVSRLSGTCRHNPKILFSRQVSRLSGTCRHVQRILWKQTCLETFGLGTMQKCLLKKNCPLFLPVQIGRLSLQTLTDGSVLASTQGGAPGARIHVADCEDAAEVGGVFLTESEGSWACPSWPRSGINESLRHLKC